MPAVIVDNLPPASDDPVRLVVTAASYLPVSQAFDRAGLPIFPITDITVGVAPDDLAWWCGVPHRVRPVGEVAHGAFRIEAAAAAINEFEDGVV